LPKILDRMSLEVQNAMTKILVWNLVKNKYRRGNHRRPQAPFVAYG